MKMRKKKIFAVLMALTLSLSMSACGKTDGDNQTDSTTTEAGTTEAQAASTEEISGEKFDTSLWTLTYDSEIWSYDEEDVSSDETYANATFTIPNGEDGYIASVEISVSIEDPEDYRSDLKDCGFDAYEYVVNNAYETVNVGGIDCLMHDDDYWGDPCRHYIARDEAASASIFISVMGDPEDERVATLLKGLAIHVEDIGNEDCPWPWDGTPFSASDSSGMAGTVTVESQWLPITDCIITDATFDHSVAVGGDKAYILGDCALKQYAYDGSSLKYESEIECNENYIFAQSTNDGSIWISGFAEPLLVYKDGTQTASYEGTDMVSMHPSGEWGISWFSGPDCAKVTFSEGTISLTPITFAEASSVSNVTVDNDYIYVCGNAADDSGHKVYVYNTDGILQTTLTDGDGECLGSVTFMAQTSDGFIGFDGNMREVILWTKDGTYIGALSDTDLFGTNYPWFCASTMLSDGSIFTIMTDDRVDESAKEVVAFKLSGF